MYIKIYMGIVSFFFKGTYFRDFVLQKYPLSYKLLMVFLLRKAP